MSTVKANFFLDSAGGNTAQINGITPALSSQAQAEAGTDNTTLMTPLRVAQAIATEAVGVNQTWQNLTASRTTGTVYQNTTGRPIMVAISRDSTGVELFEISTDGISFSTLMFNGSQGSDTSRFQPIIPNLLYYRYSGGAAGTTDWWELR